MSDQPPYGSSYPGQPAYGPPQSGPHQPAHPQGYGYGYGHPQAPPPPAKSGMPGWLIGLLVALLVPLLCCCGGAALTMAGGSDSSDDTQSSAASTSESEATTTTPDESSTSQTPSPSSKKSSPKPKKSAPIKVTAGEIVDEFSENELAGDQKYDGKSVQVSGVVDKIDTDLFNDESYLLEITDGGSYTIFGVTCHDMSTDVLATVKVGDPITVVGDFDDGGDLGVDLKGCKIV